MLYIHKLLDLNRKSAEIESISVIRELKSISSMPITNEFLQAQLSAYFATAEEVEMMETALALIPQSAEELVRLMTRKDSAHEPINVYRSIQALKQLQQPLQNSIGYVQQLQEIESKLSEKMSFVLNAIPYMKQEQMTAVNTSLSAIFESLLRSKDILFNHQDIVNEAQTGLVNGLLESFAKGYLFHFTLEEELQKSDFALVKLRIAPDKLEEAESIRQNIFLIKRGIDAAYNINMRTVELSVLLYSYIKWASSPQ